MNSKHVFYGMSGVIGLLILAILGCAFFANGLLVKQSERLSVLKLKSAVLEQEQTSLVKAKKDIKKYENLEKIAKTIVPQDKDQAQAVREIIKIASETGMNPSSITFPASNLGGAGTTAAGSGPSGASALTQLTPVKDIKGLYVLQITINQDSSSTVPYDRFINFLERLENNRRTAQVSNIVLKPSAQDRNQLSFTLIIDEYIKP